MKKKMCDVCFLAEVQCHHKNIKKLKMKGLSDFLKAKTPTSKRGIEMIALERIKEIEKIGRLEGGYASTDDEFLLKAFNVMREIATENASAFGEVERLFEERMK